MNLKQIQDILNLGVSDAVKEKLIISSLAADKNVIPEILEILAHEREEMSEFTMEINMQLSRAHLGLNNKALNKGNFINAEIRDFYKKYGHLVQPCFNNKFHKERRSRKKVKK